MCVLLEAQRNDLYMYAICINQIRIFSIVITSHRFHFFVVRTFKTISSVVKYPVQYHQPESPCWAIHRRTKYPCLTGTLYPLNYSVPFSSPFQLLVILLQYGKWPSEIDGWCCWAEWVLNWGGSPGLRPTLPSSSICDRPRGINLDTSHPQPEEDRFRKYILATS